MDDIHFKCDEEFDVRCGEIYFTTRGYIQIHCTICEKKYDKFQEYVDHVEQKHRPLSRMEFNTKLNYDTYMVFLDDDSCSNSEVIEDLEEYISEAFDQPLAMEINSKCLGSVSKADASDHERRKYEFQNTVLGESQNTESGPKTKNLKMKTDHKFECPHCKYTGKDKANFNAHVKRHFNINKNKRCSECSMSFFSSCELKRHLITHTGEKPFLCQECGKAYSNKPKLSAHFKRHLNIRDVPCLHCEKRFFSKQALEEHMAVHTDDRRYSCEVCQATFKLKKGLRTHYKIHENQLQYKCTLCSARFNQNPGLRAHMRSKHDYS